MNDCAGNRPIGTPVDSTREITNVSALRSHRVRCSAPCGENPTSSLLKIVPFPRLHLYLIWHTVSWATRVNAPSWISRGSAVFAQHTAVPNIRTQNKMATHVASSTACRRCGLSISRRRLTRATLCVTPKSRPPRRTLSVINR